MRTLKPILRSLCLGVLLLVAVAGCKTNDATGRSQFLPLTWEQEVQLGNEATPQFLNQSGGEIPDTSIANYVSKMGQRLANESEMPGIDWEFYVLDSEVINAFALPGGKVFISRELLSRMNNEAQLAGVLGHEIGHVTARHGNERMGKAKIAQGLIIAIGVGGAVSNEKWLQVLGIGTAAGGQLFLLKYSRDNELEADELGVRYMSRVGYNPVGQVQVMQILQAATGGSGPPEWLSTHPTSDTRIKKLEKLIAEEYPLHRDPSHYRMGAADFQKNVLTPLSKLPRARHRAAGFIGPEDIFRVAGITWEQAIGAGCDCHPVATD